MSEYGEKRIYSLKSHKIEGFQGEGEGTNNEKQSSIPRRDEILSVTVDKVNKVKLILIPSISFITRLSSGGKWRIMFLLCKAMLMDFARFPDWGDETLTLFCCLRWKLNEKDFI